MTLSDLEWLSKIFNDTKHRAASLRQQNYYLSLEILPRVRILDWRKTTATRRSIDSSDLTRRTIIIFTRRHQHCICRTFREYSILWVRFIFYIKKTGVIGQQSRHLQQQWAMSVLLMSSQTPSQTIEVRVSLPAETMDFSGLDKFNRAVSNLFLLKFCQVNSTWYYSPCDTEMFLWLFQLPALSYYWTC